MPTSMIEESLEYLNKGGKKGGITQHKVIEEAARQGYEPGKIPDGFFDTVIDLLPDGRKPTDAEFERAVGRAAMRGKVPGQGNNVRYFLARRQGWDAKFIPRDVSDVTREKAKKWLEENGYDTGDDNVGRWARWQMEPDYVPNFAEGGSSSLFSRF